MRFLRLCVQGGVIDQVGGGSMLRGALSARTRHQDLRRDVALGKTEHLSCRVVLDNAAIECAIVMDREVVKKTGTLLDRLKSVGRLVKCRVVGRGERSS